MRSAWVEREAKQAVDRYGGAGFAPTWRCGFIPRACSAATPDLVLHGGGNSSLKTNARDLAGEEVAVLRIKGSGADMGAIEPAGFPAVRLAPLRSLRTRKTLSDGEMARAQRAFLIDPQAPSPSVEMLLHAFMPAKFIDHTHAAAVLSLIDQPNAAALCAEVFGGRLGFVPYLMPGFGLAKKAAEVFDKNQKVEGLILDKHGIFTFGADAREAYERMIEFVTLAENRLKKNRKAVFAGTKLPQRIAPAIDVAPILRGACTLRDGGGEGAHRRPILEFRASDAILNFVNGKDVAAYARAGVITPDHVIRTKPWPLIVPAPQDGKLDAFKAAAYKAAQKFIDEYTSLFRAEQKARQRRGHARSGAARRAGAGPRPVRAGREQARRHHCRRHRASRGRKHHRCGGNRALHLDFASRHVRYSNIGRWNWPSLARARICRSPARSRSSPAPAAPSARRPRRLSQAPARKWPCSISMPTRRWKRPKRSAATPSRSNAM